MAESCDLSLILGMSPDPSPVLSGECGKRAAMDVMYGQRHLCLPGAQLDSCG
jgi:hypothetical protein